MSFFLVLFEASDPEKKNGFFFSQNLTLKHRPLQEIRKLLRCRDQDVFLSDATDVAVAAAAAAASFIASAAAVLSGYRVPEPGVAPRVLVPERDGVEE